jgi:excisionase family DNA binding protein
VPLILNLSEAAALLGIGRNGAYRMAADGTLPVIRLGPRRLVVSREALRDLLEKGIARHG